MLDRATRRAGLREIRRHDCRHSFTSQLVIAGVPLHQVQAWLGHSTITMTMRYAHLAPGNGADLIGVLERGTARAYGN
jgi:site-specific recombinase XerD